MNLSNHTIPAASTIFPIKFKVLEVRKKISSENKQRSYQNKILQVNARIRYYSCTIHYSRNDIFHASRHYSLYHTNNMHTTQNTQKHYHNELIPNQPHLNDINTNTLNTNILKILLRTKLLVIGNDVKFDRGRTPPN